ncbi:MAG: hypothetical protein JWO43_303 [Candidatus Adlerbacteria bacterium]|nr:hypothetical protein [Candidatus Adlerbacteria bacterium]
MPAPRRVKSDFYHMSRHDSNKLKRFSWRFGRADNEHFKDTYAGVLSRAFEAVLPDRGGLRVISHGGTYYKFTLASDITEEELELFLKQLEGVEFSSKVSRPTIPTEGYPVVVTIWQDKKPLALKKYILPAHPRVGEYIKVESVDAQMHLLIDRILYLCSYKYKDKIFTSAEVSCEIFGGSSHLDPHEVDELIQDGWKDPTKLRREDLSDFIDPEEIVFFDL